MKICLIGCGKMGSSLLEGWSSLKVIKHISIVEPNLAEIPSKLLNIKTCKCDDIKVSREKPDVLQVLVHPAKQHCDSHKRFIKSCKDCIAIIA